MASKAELLKQAQELGLEVTENNTVAEISAALNAHADANPQPPEQPTEGDADGVTPPEGTGEVPAVEGTADSGEEVNDQGTEDGESRSVVDEADDEGVEEEEAPAAPEAPAPTPDPVPEQPAPAPAPASTPAPAPQVTPVTEGSEIAQAIVDGLGRATEKKKIRITADPSVQSRFSVVRNKQGEILLRENATGVLSKVQLESLEEKEASIQGQEVEEVHSRRDEA